PISGHEALQVDARIKAHAQKQDLDYKTAARQVYHSDIAKLEAIGEIEKSVCGFRSVSSQNL
ncbi:hypothetical protein H0H81_007434, partial [Sphagnurus paluster]